MPRLAAASGPRLVLPCSPAPVQLRPSLFTPVMISLEMLQTRAQMALVNAHLFTQSVAFLQQGPTSSDATYFGAMPGKTLQDVEAVDIASVRHQKHWCHTSRMIITASPQPRTL